MIESESASKMFVIGDTNGYMCNQAILSLCNMLLRTIQPKGLPAHRHVTDGANSASFPNPSRHLPRSHVFQTIRNLLCNTQKFCRSVPDPLLNKNHSTQDSQMVPHSGTSWAILGLDCGDLTGSGAFQVRWPWMSNGVYWWIYRAYGMMCVGGSEE